MTSYLKPITIFGGPGGPNPWKVIMILEELSIPFTHINIPHSELHTPSFEKYNPNGRVPAIIDPNFGDFVLWESGAIIEYLIERYDKEGKLSFQGEGNSEEKRRFECKQWLHFQMSGQGPYFGQVPWFKNLHPENVPSAILRYQNEAKRVVQVRDNHLRLNGQEYLVGDKVTYADIAFVMWDTALTSLIFEKGEVDWEKDYPHWFAWYQKLLARPAIKKALENKTADMIASGNPFYVAMASKGL